MTKADIVKEIHERNGLSRAESADMVELVVETLKANLAEGKTVKIAGFGTFLVRKKGERKGRNLKTGEEISISPRRVVTFKASPQLKAMVEKV
jgi:integration host factor subunit alpha